MREKDRQQEDNDKSMCCYVELENKKVWGKQKLDQLAL